jgi:hypothetical protein
MGDEISCHRFYPVPSDKPDVARDREAHPLDNQIHEVDLQVIRLPALVHLVICLAFNDVQPCPLPLTAALSG